MTIANKYIQQCKSLFPVYGKLERTFLNRLKVQVNEHLDLFPDISYNELVKQFGSPREVVMEYYDNIEDDYLLSKIDLAKKVKKFLRNPLQKIGKKFIMTWYANVFAKIA